MLFSLVKPILCGAEHKEIIFSIWGKLFITSPTIYFFENNPCSRWIHEWLNHWFPKIQSPQKKMDFIFFFPQKSTNQNASPPRWTWTPNVCLREAGLTVQRLEGPISSHPHPLPCLSGFPSTTLFRDSLQRELTDGFWNLHVDPSW